jgi:hypothetical protein
LAAHSLRATTDRNPGSAAAATFRQTLFRFLKSSWRRADQSANFEWSHACVTRVLRFERHYIPPILRRGNLRSRLTRSQFSEGFSPDAIRCASSPSRIPRARSPSTCHWIPAVRSRSHSGMVGSRCVRMGSAGAARGGGFGPAAQPNETLPRWVATGISDEQSYRALANQRPRHLSTPRPSQRDYPAACTEFACSSRRSLADSSA